MAERSQANVTAVEATEIPAYVIRPPQPRGARYHAPRLSRTSLKELRAMQRRSVSQQLVESWRTAWGPTFPGFNESRSNEDSSEPMAVLRYQAKGGVTSRTSGMPRGRGMFGFASARRLAQAGFTAASFLLAASLGWGVGSHLPAPAMAQASVPASTLIATQNLPLKLPMIEHQVAGHGLEEGKRGVNLSYVVQSGDTFASVGKKFGLRPRTVRLVNLLPMGYRLKSGQKLTITPLDGAYHRVRAGERFAELAQRYGVTQESLLEHNPAFRPDRVTPDQPLFVPGATELRYPEPRQAKERGYRQSGPWAKRLSASRSLIGQFGNRVGELAWPAAGQFSSPFGIRGYSFHPGVDICNAIGTPIRAAKGGVVVSAGWMGAYGYAIDIDHGGGVITRYGHCSRLEVASGQNVEGGQEIAKMGSTGRSTGPHVHFEVRIQGRVVNPTNFF